MKLVFPGGEHPQVLLGLGVNRVGSDPGANVVIDRPGVNPQHCRLHVTGQGVMLDVPEGTPISVNGRQVDGLIALRPGDAVDLGGVVARLAGIGAHAPESSGAAETALVPANDDLGATSVRPAMPKYALRGVGGSDEVAAQVAAERARIRTLAEKIRAGGTRGFRGESLRHLVCIGIGARAWRRAPSS